MRLLGVTSLCLNLLAKSKFKLKGLYGVKLATASQAAINAMTTSASGRPLFNYDLTSSRDHYSGVIVGRNPFRGAATPTS